jgi:hypothetical protein
MYTPGKRIVISTHAAQRMTQRGATVAEVEDAARGGRRNEASNMPGRTFPLAESRR